MAQGLGDPPTLGLGHTPQRLWPVSSTGRERATVCWTVQDACSSMRQASARAMGTRVAWARPVWARTQVVASAMVAGVLAGQAGRTSPGLVTVARISFGSPRSGSRIRIRHGPVPVGWDRWA